MVDDGKTRADVLLDSCTVGLHVPPMTWGVQYNFRRNAVLQFLASAPYDAEDDISCYSDFLAGVRGASNTKA
jgi:UDP-2-acetamido-3-amino-2,3-dideoxy-glucuronate N-acetyltransferase